MQHIQQSREDVQQDTEGRQWRWLASCVATHLWHREGVPLQSDCFACVCDMRSHSGFTVPAFP